MSEEKITVGVLKLLLEPHKKELELATAKQTLIEKEIRETNMLLRDDINTTKSILNQHIKDSSRWKDNSDKNFKRIFDTLRAREDFYKAGKALKWAMIILISGGLTAAGAGVYTNWSKAKAVDSYEQSK